MDAQKTASAPTLLSYKHLKAIGIDYSREHLWRLESKNKFPRRLYLSPQRIVWIESEIKQFLADRSAERATRIYRDH